MSTWKIITSRVTFLPTPAMFPRDTSPLDVFRAVWGVEPDTYKKSTNPFALSTAQGDIGEVQVNCSLAINRADFNFGPVIPPQLSDSQPELRFIENASQLQKCLDTLISAIKSETIRFDAGRVAIAVQFVRLEDNIPDVNRALVETIPTPYKVNLTNEEDFILQINSPTSLNNSQKTVLNVVRNWSLVRFQLLNIAVSASLGGQASGAFPSVFPSGPSTIGGSLNIEVNNVPSEVRIPSEDQAEILSSGLEILGRNRIELGLRVEGFGNAD